jgi:hypothetical protein
MTYMLEVMTKTPIEKKLFLSSDRSNLEIFSFRIFEITIFDGSIYSIEVCGSSVNALPTNGNFRSSCQWNDLDTWRFGTCSSIRRSYL